MIRYDFSIAMPLRPRSSVAPTFGRATIKTVGLTQRATASSARAITAAIALASVAGRTDEDLCAAKVTEKAAYRIAHRRSSNNRRAHRHSEKCRAMLRTRSYLHRRAGNGIGFTCNVWADAVFFLRPLLTALQRTSSNPRAGYLTGPRRLRKLRQKSYDNNSPPNMRPFA